MESSWRATSHLRRNALLERTTPARVWRGSDVPTEQQGIKVLGVPLGHDDFVRQNLSNVHEEHRLLTRIPLLGDVQSAWLLLVHCRASSGQLPDQTSQTRSS